MHWLITFATLCAFNKPVLSWEEAAPRGQVSCGSRLQCLLLSSSTKSDASTKETAAPRDTNTWYPIPKWKVIFQANKNRHSEPYFNKQDPRRTDGSIRDNDFSPLPDHAKRGGEEVFERLNIQFFPLLEEDGNVTTGRGSRNEYVALFVIYAHSTRIDIRKVRNDSDGGTLSLDLEMKSMNGSENASESCEGIDNCLKHVRMFLPHIVNANKNNSTLFTNRSNVIMIPITKNMSIEMKARELDNNYTALIIPFTNETKDGNGFKLAMDSEALHIPISKNVSMVVKMDDIFHCNKSLNGNNCFIPNNGLNLSLTHSTEQLENNMTKEESDAGYDQMDHQNNYSDSNDINTNNFIRDFTLGTGSSENDTVRNSFYDNIYTSTESSLNSTTSNFIFDETSESEIVGQNQKDEDKPFNLNSESKNTSINNKNDLYNASNPLADGSFLIVNRLNYTKNNTSKRPSFTIREEIYKKTLGPYEVKEIRGEDFPFIATIELIINNKEIGSQESDKKLIQLKNFDPSYPRNDSASNSNIATILQRQKRYKINETSGIQHKTNWSENDIKTKTTNDGYFSHKTEDSYKYPNRAPRVILNKAEDSKSAAGVMNHYSLILPKEFGEEQNNSSRLFLFSGETGSYSYTTISSGNEEFNQNRAGKFGNKGLISNEISDKPAGVDGVKSNQTAQGFRNKRDFALPTLIPNKDPRENRSVLKKSELQIAAEGSLDEDSSEWKMKIPPGVEHLRRNGIKTGKICDLRDGCKGINDVFNSMTKSERYEDDDVRKESFEAIESFDVGERTDDKMKFPNYFMREMSDKAIDVKVSNNRESGFFEEEGESNSSQKNPLGGGSSFLNIQRHELPIKTISKQFRMDQKGEMNLEHGRIEPHGNSSSNEINFKAIEGNETLNLRSLPKINAQKSPQVAKILLRKKRSQSGTVPNFYPRNSFYLMNLNNFPQPQVQSYPRNANPHLNNASSPTFRMSPNERQDTDTEWKDYMLYLPIKTQTDDGDTLRSPNTFQTQPESKMKEWWFKRGSAKRQRGWQNRWRPSDEEVNPSSVRNIDQGYRLVILIPDTAEQQRPRLNPSVSTRKPVYTEQPGQTQGSSDRERESDDWLRNQWTLVNTENDGGNRNNVNVRTPSMEPPSIDIINMPRAVTNLQTATKPTVQGVSSTTPKPGGNSTPSTTTKASGTIPTTTPNPKTTSNPWSMPWDKPWPMPRSNPWSMPGYKPWPMPGYKPWPMPGYKPWPMPTSKPWTFDDPWDIRWSSNYWTVSQNPWKNYPTRPPMMMGGMTGGD